MSDVANQDFHPEPRSFLPEPLPVSPQWIAAPLPSRPIEPSARAIDTSSRVISFVIGFALATLIAWLGSIRADDLGATPITDRVAPDGIPVVTATTPEKVLAPLAPVTLTGQAQR